MRHPGRVAIHVHLHEHRIEKLAFIERHLDPLPIHVGVLISAGHRVNAHRLPRLSEAFILQRSPLWTSAASSFLRRRLFLPLPLLRGHGRDSDNRFLVLASFFPNLLFFLDHGLVLLLSVCAVGR
jgi:hypothetical protein